MLDLGTLEAKIKLDGADKFKKSLEESADASEEVGSSLKNKLGNALDFLKNNFKTIAIAAGVALVAAFAKLTKASIDVYKKTEQLQGGVKKLFGKEAAAQVEANAQAAFATMGISANQYMETVTSFSASLLQSLGGDTEKAAKIANMAMQDMADNASIFGTDIQQIQNAYMGFARGQYQLLDNLKLGYGGTKKEMERLLADAGKLTGQKYDINNLTDVYTAIHVIQKEQKLTGNAAKEASKTIEGSIASTKAAWENLLGALADPKADIGKALSGLVDSVGNVISNIVPVVGRILLRILNGYPTFFKAVHNMVLKLVGQLADALPTFLPKLLMGIFNLVTGIAKSLPKIMLMLNIVVGKLVIGIIKGLIVAIPQLVTAGAKMMLGLIQGYRQNLSKLWPLITYIPKRIVALLAKAGTALYARGAQFITGLLNGIKSRWAAVKAWIASIPSKIKAALGNLGKLLFGAGKDIMSGLKDGIDAGWEKITSSVSKMGEWIKAHKGPKEYDLKLLVPNGNWIMKGLETGLEQGKEGLKKTLSGIASEIGATPFTATAQLAYAGEGAPVNNSEEQTIYNVYINGTKINDDSQIRANFVSLLNEMARKGMM